MSEPPCSFSAFMDRALYAPGLGFYETGGRAGRRGDFLTSPEVGPLFGAVVGRALDTWWTDLGRPDPFAVEDHGAGPGTLARSVLLSRPACASALRWTMVERSAAQRAGHPAHLPHAGHLDGGAGGADIDWPAPGGGPAVASAAARPGAMVHVMLANELLDNLSFDLFELTVDGWAEVHVARAPNGRPEPVVVPATSADRHLLESFAPDAPLGGRAPLQRAAGAWVAESLATLESGGRLVVLDYASTTDDLAARPWREWLRTFAVHGRGGDPFDRAGMQDITAEVCVDQLAAAARPPDADRPQSEFLRAHGLDGLVAEGRAAWHERAGPADLAALRGRSRVTEADTLCDGTGLGAFRVLEWRA